MQKLIERPWILLCWGAPAAGKSTIAAGMSQRFVVPRLSSDALNRAVLGEHFEAGLRPAIYEGMLAMARSILAGGGRVVLDGTFLHRSLRQEVEQFAEEAGAVLISVQVDCDFSLRWQRNSQRPSDQRVPDGWLCQAHSRARLDRREAHLYLDTGGQSLSECQELVERMIWSRLRRRYGMWMRRS